VKNLMETIGNSNPRSALRIHASAVSRAPARLNADGRLLNAKM
jgi:hypothetical protein